jgi:hypothetical protein
LSSSQRSFASENEEPSTQTRDEGGFYLSSPVVVRGKDFDLLKWWQDSASAYPRLAQVAKDILAIPLAQVGVERVFNSSRDVIGDRRHRLQATTLQKIMFLKDSIAQEDQEDIMDTGNEETTDAFEHPLELPAPGADVANLGGDTEPDTDDDTEQSPSVRHRPKRMRTLPKRYL